MPPFVFQKEKICLRRRKIGYKRSIGGGGIFGKSPEKNIFRGITRSVPSLN